MKTCIYCKTQNQVVFKGVEHLIPQSFGTFGTSTPTLDCVCDDCNNLFGRTLDQAFARDSFEGITRYKKGILSSEQRLQSRLKFNIDNAVEMGNMVGARLEGVDSKSGQVLAPITQFQILNLNSNEYEVYNKSEIKTLNLNENDYGIIGTRKIRLFAPSLEEYEILIEELQKIGIDASKAQKFGAPFVQGKKDGDVVTIPVFMEGTIDNTIKRAIVKVLINFSAKYIGIDEVLKPEWDEARNYVRYGLTPIKGRLSSKPFWGEETEHLRFPDDSFNIIVDNENGNLIGKLQVYNLFTYEFILVENYNISEDAGKGARFTKDKPPVLGEKKTLS